MSPWVKLDDGFHANEKVMDASLPALGLHVLALSFCGHQLTNGRVPESFARLRANGSHRELAAELVTVGLWSPLEAGGWKINDYLKYNPSKAKVMKRRKTNAENGRNGGLASGEARGKRP